MARREHLHGHTRFYDLLRDVEFRNSLEVAIKDGRAVLQVKGEYERAGHTIESRDPAFVRPLAMTLLHMRREAWRRRKVRTDFKEPRRRRRARQVCPSCNGRGLLEDRATGEEWACPMCNAG